MAAKKPMLYARIEDMLSEMLKDYASIKQVDKSIIYQDVCRRFRLSKDDLNEVMRELDVMDGVKMNAKPPKEKWVCGECGSEKFKPRHGERICSRCGRRNQRTKNTKTAF